MDNSTGTAAPGGQDAPIVQPYNSNAGNVDDVPTAVGSDYMTAAAATPNAPVSTRRRAISIGIGVLSLFLIAAAFIVRGEAERFVTVGLQFAPLAILAALAYMGLRSVASGALTYIWLLFLSFGILLSIVLFTLFGFVRDFPLFFSLLGDKNAAQRLAADRTLLCAIFDCAEVGPGMLWTVFLLSLVLLVASSMLLQSVRNVVSRIVPVDPENFVHKIALFILVIIGLGPFVPLLVLGGEPPLLELVKGTSQNLPSGADIGTRPIDLVYQFVWMIPATLVAAGWLTVRKFPAVLVRLGMVRPSLRQVLFGVGAGLVLAVFAMFGLDPGVNSLWKSLGWQPTDVQAFDSLLSQLKTPLGALLIGVTAGIGEEMAVRGLLQPRIGLIASNLLFTSFHAFQYGVDALISVFIIGLVLGLIRARTNTSTSAIVHGVYNFILVMTSVFVAGQAGQ